MNAWCLNKNMQTYTMKICDSDVVRVKGVFDDDDVITSGGERRSYYGNKSKDGKFSGGNAFKS